MFLEHDLIRPSFARRSGLRTRVRLLAGPSTGSGGKPVHIFRDHALLRAGRSAIIDGRTTLADSSPPRAAGPAARAFRVNWVAAPVPVPATAAPPQHRCPE